MKAEEIIQAMQERRKALGMTFYELSKKGRISSSTMCRWEHDKCRPTLDVGCTVADALGMEIIVRVKE